MKISVMLYSLSSIIRSGEMTIPQVCKFLKDECDVDAIEPMHAGVADMGVGEFKKVLDDLGQRVACYIGGGDFVQPTDEAQQPAIDAGKAAVDASLEVGCKTLLLTTGGCKPDLPKPEARKRIAAGLQKVIEYAKPLGVTVTIEDVGAVAAPYGAVSEVLDMFELAGPDLMFTYDNGNFLTQGEDPNAALDAVWDRVVHVHCKDWRKVGDDEDTTRVCTGAGGVQYQGVPCGEGLLDYPANMAELKRRGYTGYLSFEYEGPDDPRDAAKVGIANIRALL